MTDFVCRVGTPSGEVKTEVREADDQEKLKKELEQQGYYVFSITKRGFSLTFAGLKMKQKVKSQNFVIFNQELAALVRSGLPLIQCVEILWERQEDPLLRRILAEIIDKLKSGESLSDAFAGYGEIFPKMYATILKSGERSGDLEKVLRRFIDYQKIIISVKRKVKGALVYPIILFALSLVLITIMMTYVIPKFTIFYEGMDAELPFLTALIINLSHLITGNLLLICGIIVGASFFFATWVKTPLGRRIFDGWLLRMPIFGTIFHRFSLTQFCRSLATLVEGGTPVVHALTIAANTISNVEISTKVREIISHVHEGDALYTSLETTGKFTPIAIQMIKVGESTGSLEVMLHNAADFYDEEIDIKLQRIVTLVEPVMLVFMGSVVAVLLAAVYLPLITLIGQMR